MLDMMGVHWVQGTSRKDAQCACVQVRAYAVEILQGRGDDEVQGYLLQLVQVPA